MSRVILSRYLDHGQHVVVGWDHPAMGAFWQEFATADEVKAAEAWMEDNGDDKDKYGTEEYRQFERIAETEIKRDGGMWPGIALSKLRESMPEDLRPLMTDKVLDLLADHSADPNSGRLGPIDLTVTAH